MNKKEKVELISTYFDKILPNASCELNYTKPYELVIAVMLSAQTTDKSVNKVTETLFKKYPSLDAFYNAKYEDVFDIIKSLGLAKNKARNVLGIAKGLVEDNDSIVPNDFDKLTALPGVGRKTANVIQAEIFHKEVIAVDTHVERVSKRLGLASLNDSPLEVEMKLMKVFPKERRVLTHHQMIHFGRYYCMSQNPKCEGCPLKEICKHK